jgi:threonine/homoserine/homoserine lactone efflux protein
VDAGILASAFGLGAALGLLPGPVQFLLLTESTRGGWRRGFAAQAGANGTFGVLILALAAGLSLLAPGPGPLRALRIAGGLFLLFLAADGLRAALKPAAAVEAPRTGSTPFLKGVLAVVLNPGGWLFLATTASALFTTAVTRSGRPFAMVAAAAMLVGVSIVDGSFVLLGGGVRRFHASIARWLTPVLACGLGVFGVVLVVEGIRG